MKWSPLFAGVVCGLLCAAIMTEAATEPAKPAAAKAATPADTTAVTAASTGTARSRGTVATAAGKGSAKGGPVKPKSATAAKAVKPKQKPGEVLDVDWRDLLPENERAHYSAAAPPPVHGPLGEGGPPAVQKVTTTVNEELAGMNVRLPGFIVPIGAPRDGLITEFFLVPYIGACIHVPPPPPNQMVYVMSANAIPEESIHEAYWVTGKMRIENRTTPLGTAAYALGAGKVELYQY